MNDSSNKLNDESSFLSMIDAVDQIRRWSSVKSGDVRIMNAEMQLIRLIGNEDGINVGNAAKTLGVTKGAVSQTLSRLDKKGMVIREQDPENASRLRLHLTEKGLQVHEAHERYHEELNHLEQELLSQGSEESRAFLAHYLRTISEKMNQEYEILSNYLSEKP